MSRIVDAVTAVLLHRGQLLVVKRQPFLRAFPGYSAFPGGKVDPEDAQGDPLPAAWQAFEPRLLRALLRELREEIKLDLQAVLATGDPISIRHLGIALTPPTAPLRFNTHFFAVELDQLPPLTADAHEVASMAWATPDAWLRQYETGQIIAAPPTVAVLRTLAADPAATDVPGLHFETRQAYPLPVIESVIGVRQILVKSHTLPPAHHTNCFLFGDLQSHRVLVDPSPADDKEMERLIELAQRFGIHEVFLTHHHPDHRERANAIARHFNAPIGMSEDTNQRIRAKAGLDWFEGLSVNIYREGDMLCRWQGQPVRIYEVPGHDEGQLALMPDGRAWCLVGDLIQGLGTVVIGKPEGNMNKYLASLRRIIELDPMAIYPSHGIGLGGTYRLRDTLHHREMREQQVLALHHEGRDLDSMLTAIYPDLDARLLPLAKMNIESHLDKLREDGVIAG